jgi:BirA family biotin operon repressor/biotin-[acetyl-CoA-carboxylase] ligase
VRAGLVVADVVDELLGSPAARLKWPNDVLLDDRKLACVLCETRWQGESPDWLALGVGVNVCNELGPEFAGRAERSGSPCWTARGCAPTARACTRCSRDRAPDAPSGCRAFAERDWLRGRELRAVAARRGLHRWCAARGVGRGYVAVGGPSSG